MLILLTAFSAVATIRKQEQSSGNQNTGQRGGLFTQLPEDPGVTSEDWWAYWSASFFCDSYYQSYEMFTDVASSIQGVHWWGMSILDNDSTYVPGDPDGMTFTITFYEDNNTKPGAEIRSYNDIKPSITSTGVLYPSNKPYELYFFEYILAPSINLSDGWISIVSTGSDNNCAFFWLESSTGAGNAFVTKDGELWDHPYSGGFSLVFTDGTKTSLEIVDMKGGVGVTLGIKNNGNTTVDNYPVDFIIQGGLLKKIKVNAGETISVLAPGDTAPLQTGLFFGLGKITIFVVGDGIISYTTGKQLFVFTMV